MPPQSMHLQDRKQIPIWRILQDKILNNGSCIFKTDNTRYNWLTKKEDTIDHLIMNTPQNVVGTTVLKTGESDHNIMVFTIKTTNPPTHYRYYLSRNYKLINWDQMKTYVTKDTQLVDGSLSSDPHVICKSIQEVITHHLDTQAQTPSENQVSTVHFPTNLPNGKQEKCFLLAGLPNQ